MTRLIRYLLLLSLLLQVAYISPDRLTANAESLSLAWSPIVITSPTSLSPMPDNLDPLCKTYWYIIENAGGYPAYLTLNVETEAGSTNSGEWRPNIPTTGFYQIDVYIPAHGSINWNCGTGRIVDLDTNHAQYNISTPSGSKSVVANQVAGTWVSLGNHFLNKGVDNILSLSDITGETDFEQLVSFSMARFSWVATQSKSYFPVIYKDWDQASLTKVRLDSVNSYTREGISRVRFDMDEPVTYRITGTNGYAIPEQVRLTWQYSGPCGFGPESEIALALPAGSWAYDLSDTIAACPGQNTATFRIYSRGAMLQKSLNINVDAGGTLQLFQGHAFDACSLPSLDDMRFWWNQSPYEVYNIYLGGIGLFAGCQSPLLTRDYIRDVQNMGWGFIATWIGPQAPCSIWKEKMSWDVTEAYNEGKQEAVWAATKAKILGLVETGNPSSVIYYDMENFSPASQSCREVAKSFMRGWIEQLKSLGITAGLYGGTLSSYLADFWSISPRPDVIWAAEWYKIDGEYRFDPGATTNLDYLNGSYWPLHQRIVQYAGDHDESWGGRSKNIDSDFADTYLYLPRFPIYKPPYVLTPGSISDAKIEEFQLVGPGEGWLIEYNQLLWTMDNGKTWQHYRIPFAEEIDLETAYFKSPKQGWLLGAAPAGYTLYSTEDGGETWQSTILPAFELPVDPMELTFADSIGGTIKFRYRSSQAFREGFILTTLDGGLTWNKEILEQDDPVWDGSLLQSGAGAKSAATDRPKPDGALKVVWADELAGWATVFQGVCSGGGEAGYTCQSAVVLMATQDGGKTWTQIHP